MSTSAPRESFQRREPLLSILVPGNPVTQGSMKLVGRGRIIHSNPNLDDWRNTIRGLALQEWIGRDPLHRQPLEIHLGFTIARPASHYHTKRGDRTPTVKPSAPRWPCVDKDDLDKLVRAVGDALEGLIYVSDGQLCRSVASKEYGPAPGVQITIFTL